MTALLNWRFWVCLALAAGLSFTHFTAYRTGKAQVMADWTAEKLASSEAARQREKALTIANQKVDHDLQADKARRAAVERVTAGRLRDLQTALADKPDDPAPAGGADDPRGAIIYQCTAALAGLDVYAAGLAGKASALQDYARSVCVSGPD